MDGYQKRWTFSMKEVASILGISLGSAYECARRGDLPTIRLGRRLLVPRLALEDILRHTSGPK